jgi:NADP-dependent 3-hydroxy acid dehydrogenase YdfG
MGRRGWLRGVRRKASVPLLVPTSSLSKLPLKLMPSQTLIFTGTLGALRCSAQYAAYGAGRASVRQLAQTIAREMSEKGVHVVHTIANGAIVDEEGADQESGKKMSADAVGETYLWLHGQRPCLWTHELDMRPACEKF